MISDFDKETFLPGSTALSPRLHINVDACTVSVLVDTLNSFLPQTVRTQRLSYLDSRFDREEGVKRQM